MEPLQTLQNFSRLHESSWEKDKQVGGSNQLLHITENSAENDSGTSGSLPKQKKRRKKSMCKVCKNFYTKTHIPLHMKQLHSEGELLPCKICDEKFTQKYHLLIHLKTHDNLKPYECDICHKRYSKKCYMKLHKQVHSNKQFNCKRCSKTFRSILHLRAHQITHTGIKKFICKLCGYRTLTKNKLMVHLESHANQHELECTICNRVFKTRTQRVQHEKIHTGNFDHQFTCHICHKFFFKSYDLKTHIKTHNLAKKIGKRPIFTCELCGKQLLSEQSLARHKFIHLGITPFECSVCNKYFRWKSTLRQHMLLKHNENPRFKCQICGMGFLDTNKYEDHMNMHNGVKPYKCDHCPSTYTRRASLRSHLKLKHQVCLKKKLHECEFCGKKFIGPSGRWEHMRKHTGSAPLNCKICGKSFGQGERLHSHMYTHSLPYECGICKKRYSGRGNLLRHLKTHEPKVNSQPGLQHTETIQNDTHWQNMNVIKHEPDNASDDGNSYPSVQQMQIKSEPSTWFTDDNNASESNQINQTNNAPIKSERDITNVNDSPTHLHDNLDICGNVKVQYKKETTLPIDKAIAKCADPSLVSSSATTNNSNDRIFEPAYGNMIEDSRFKSEDFEDQTGNPSTAAADTELCNSAQGGVIVDSISRTNTSLHIPQTIQHFPVNIPAKENNLVHPIALKDLKLLKDRLVGNSSTSSQKTTPLKSEIPNAEKQIESNDSGNENLLVMKKVGSFKVNADDLKQILSGKSLLSMIKSQPQ